MLATLSMGEVRAIILVYCETESTFEGADMVLEEVWIFVEVYGLERKLS